MIWCYDTFKLLLCVGRVRPNIFPLVLQAKKCMRSLYLVITLGPVWELCFFEVLWVYFSFQKIMRILQAVWVQWILKFWKLKYQQYCSFFCRIRNFSPDLFFPKRRNTRLLRPIFRTDRSPVVIVLCMYLAHSSADLFPLVHMHVFPRLAFTIALHALLFIVADQDVVLNCSSRRQ